MKKNAALLLAAALAVAVLFALGAMLKPAPKGSVARISLDGEVVVQLDLSDLKGRWERTFTGASGLSNTVVAENGAIWVEKAACPDQICVKQGAISDRTTPIVCLPNKLIIEIVGGGESLDAAAG